MGPAHRLVRLAVVCLVALLSVACVKEEPPPPTKLEAKVEAAKDVNPDSAGRPSPVVLRFYELKSLKVFESAGFFDIYEQGSEVLGSDMLNWGELELTPGGARELAFEPDADAQYVGFIVAYRSIEQSTWRGSIALVPNQTNRARVKLEKTALVVTPD